MYLSRILSIGVGRRQKYYKINVITLLASHNQNSEHALTRTDKGALKQGNLYTLINQDN